MSPSEQASLTVESTVQTRQASRQWQPSDTLGWVLLVLLLAQYIVTVALTYQSKPFWLDEVFAYYTANTTSVGSVIQVQRTSPVGLEPPLYDILAHAFLVAFPHHHKVIRIPAAIGFLVLVLCTFFFLGRLGGAKLAVIATALLLASQSLYYASDGRPYGITLGMWGAALLFWQSARRNLRWPPLAGLAAAIAIAINDHYFAILMPLPIVIAELISFRQRAARTWRVLFAISIGYASVVLWLPFLEAASLYGKNYHSSFHLYQLTNAYKFMLLWLPNLKYASDVISALFVLFVCAGIFLLVRGGVFREAERSAEWLALCISCMIPFFGVALALKSHGTLEPRYVLYGVIGFCALAAVGIGALVQQRKTLYVALVLVLAVACAQELSVVRENRMATMREEQPLPTTPPDQTVVMADYGKFLGMKSEDDRPLPRLACVYDRKQEAKYFHTDYSTRALLNAAAIAPLPVYDADSFLKSHSAFVVAGWRDYESWWFHSWRDKNLKVESVEKEGPWTMYHVSVLPPAQN
jgi:4-amino-4-deoxy-L-arabinose transferase-like glycosyltransferase